MKHFRKITALFLMIFTTARADAFTLDYYVYGGFHVVVDAFTRMAFFFNNHEFEGLVFIIAILAVVSSALIVYSKALFNPGSFNPIAWMFPIFIGGIIYIALILPKGNLFIYDPLMNKTERVSGIPVIIVFIAGVTNKIERVITEIVSASSPHPYSDEAGGITFQLVFNTLSEPDLNRNYYLDQTLQSYIRGCVTPMLRPTGKIWDMKRHEADQHRFLSTFRNKALFAVVFKPDDIAGTPYTCTEVWDDHLSSALKNVKFDEAVESICKQSGFGSGPDQIRRCKTLIEKGASNVFALKDHGGDLPTDTILRNRMIAATIEKALTRHSVDEGVEQLTNKAVLLDGIGTGIAAKSWTNTIKAVVAVAVFSVILFLLCFVMTPWIWKILMICFGLCFFIASWGTIDVIIHEATIDGALSALAEIQRGGLSVQNLLTASPDVLKSIALMGKSRSMSILIAISVSGMLTGVSGYAFAQIGSTWQADLDRKGEQAANEVINPEQRGEKLAAMARGRSYESHATDMGYDRFSGSINWSQGERLHDAAAMHETFREEGHTLTSALQHAARTGAGTRRGHLDAMEEGARNTGISPQDFARQARSAETNLSVNRAVGEMDGKEANTPEGMDRTERIRYDAYRQALENSTRNTTMERLQYQIGGMTGETPDDQEFYSDLNTYFLADTIAKTGATLGDPDEWIDVQKNLKSMTVGEVDAMARTAKENDVSMVDIGRSIGHMNALGGLAKKDLIDSGFNQEDFRNYATFQMKMQAEKGGFMKKVAENYDGGKDAYLKDMAEYQEADLYGRAFAFTAVADRFYQEKGDAAVAFHASGMSVAVEGVDINRFENVLEPHQLRHLRDHGSGVVTFSRGENGEFLTAHTMTGKSAMTNNSDVRNSATVVDRSTRFDDSHTINHGRNTNNVTKFEVGNRTSPESAAQMSIDPQHRRILAEQLRDIDDRDVVNLSAAETKFVKENAAFLKDIVSITNTDEKAVRHNVNAGAGVRGEGGLHTSRTIPGKVVELFTGAGLNAGANVHGGYEYNRQTADTDTSQANLNFTPVAKLYNLTGRLAESEIREDISENHRHLDMEQRRQMIEDRKYDLWAEKFQAGMNTLKEDAVIRNEKQFYNNDDSEKLNDLIKNSTK